MLHPPRRPAKGFCAEVLDIHFRSSLDLAYCKWSRDTGAKTQQSTILKCVLVHNLSSYIPGSRSIEACI